MAHMIITMSVYDDNYSLVTSHTIPTALPTGFATTSNNIFQTAHKALEARIIQKRPHVPSRGEAVVLPPTDNELTEVDPNFGL